MARGIKERGVSGEIRTVGRIANEAWKVSWGSMLWGANVQAREAFPSTTSDLNPSTSHLPTRAIIHARRHSLPHVWRPRAYSWPQQIVRIFPLNFNLNAFRSHTLCLSLLALATSLTLLPHLPTPDTRPIGPPTETTTESEATATIGPLHVDIATAGGTTRTRKPVDEGSVVNVKRLADDDERRGGERKRSRSRESGHRSRAGSESGRRGGKTLEERERERADRDREMKNEAREREREREDC
jgi:hypothetical protein